MKDKQDFSISASLILDFKDKDGNIYASLSISDFDSADLSYYIENMIAGENYSGIFPSVRKCVIINNEYRNSVTINTNEDGGTITNSNSRYIKEKF